MALKTRVWTTGTPDISLREAFAEAIQNSLNEKAGTKLSLWDWAMRVPEPKAGILDFNAFPMQRELYAEGEDEREMVIQKSTQVGCSAFAVRWAMYHTDVRGATGLYVFPTGSDMYDFADARIKPVIDASPYLRSRIQPEDPQNKGLRKLGLGFLYFRGSESKRKLDSVDADHLILDEYDTLCLAAGSMVLTAAGHKPIEQVGIGDLVLSGKGRWCPVTHLSNHEAAETVRVDGHGVPGLKVTPNHPVLARRRLASQSDNDEFPVITPRTKSTRTCSVDGCAYMVFGHDLCSGHYQRWRKHGTNFDRAPVAVTHRRAGIAPRYRRRWASAEWLEAGKLPRSALLCQSLPPVAPDEHTNDWWWFVGRYLADGCCDTNSVHIDCAVHEIPDLRVRMEQIAPTRMRRYPNANAARLTISSRTLVAKLARYGRLAHGKHLTGHELSLEAEKAGALLEGYLSGDGSYNSSREMWTATTVSKALALDIALLATRVYRVVPSCFECAAPVGIAPQGPVNARVQYRVAFSRTNNGPFLDDDVAWKPVKSITEQSGCQVYDITVYRDHSFVADGCVVHNSQANIPDAERRLSGPLSKGLIRRLGVPSIPSYGIAAKYEESDQRKWMVKCEFCAEGWQTISFHENVDLKLALRVCRKCRKPLDVGTGQWVATYPDRSVRGYHITRLIAPTLKMDSIITASKKRSPGDVQVFWNKDLGEPYAPAEGRLSREALQAAQNIGGGFTQVPGYVGNNLVTMGIDVASTRALTIRISEHPNDRRKIALFIGEVESFNDLELLMERYAVNMAIIDHLPEGRLARAFAEKFAGRVYLVAFDTTPNPKTADVVKINEDMRFVSVRRTELMDATAELIRAQKNALPLDLPHGYVEAMQAPVRVVVKDDLGRSSVTYKSAGADDYFMAEAYDVVASEMWLYRTELDRAKTATFRQLDDMLEFERSHLGDYDEDAEYRPGGREEYEPNDPR